MAMTTLLASLLRALRWLAGRPVILASLIGAAVIAWYRHRAKRADVQRDAAIEARGRAEDTAAVTTDALERRDTGARTREDVIDAARRETEAHPDDADAAARGAREYARRRFDVVHETDAHDRADDPVRGEPAADAATRGRGR